MAGYLKRKSIKGAHVRRATISIDVVTDCAIKCKAELAGISYSAAVCELAMSGALLDDALVIAIKRAAFEGVKKHLIETGYHEGLAHALAMNINTAPQEGVSDGHI